MNRLILAMRVFGRVLFHPELAERARNLLQPEAALPPEARGMIQAKAAPSIAPARTTAPVAAPSIAQPTPTARPAPARSDAIQLLAVLQREARLVDFLKENIAPYEDAQIGAAVRDVHRGAAAVLDRLFALKPVMNDPEGAQVSVPAGADAGRIRLTGNVVGQPPYRGAVRHQGWEAAKLELPEWTGSPEVNRVIAPAEVEVG
jgi:hypothetical protein